MNNYIVTVYTGHGIQNYPVLAPSAHQAADLAAEMTGADRFDIFQTREVQA